ncbi:hypothetical protein AOLI_G00229020 [Acnodon oligacanthus]
MRCQLCRLQKGRMIDEWFPLTSHVPLKDIEPSSLRVRAWYSMEKIMPEEVYSEFKELNPSKLERNEDVNVNLAHLLSLVSQLMEKIFMATEIFPPNPEVHIWVFTEIWMRSGPETQP